VLAPSGETSQLQIAPSGHGLSGEHAIGAQRSIATHGPQQPPGTEGTWPVAQTGGGIAQTARRPSQLTLPVEPHAPGIALVPDTHAWHSLG
jgi:hypothetical protein